MAGNKKVLSSDLENIGQGHYLQNSCNNSAKYKRLLPYHRFIYFLLIHLVCSRRQLISFSALPRLMRLSLRSCSCFIKSMFLISVKAKVRDREFHLTLKISIAMSVLDRRPGVGPGTAFRRRFWATTVIAD